MTPFIMVVLGFLLLLPILYFLPINIDIKGKLSLAGAAFMMAALIIVGKDLFSIWQLVLMLFSVFFLTVYLFEKKYGHWFSIRSIEENDLYSEIATRDESIEQESRQHDHYAIEEKIEETREEIETFMEEDIFSDHELETDHHSRSEEIDYIAELEGATLSEIDEDEASFIIEELDRDELLVRDREMSWDEHIPNDEDKIILRDFDIEEMEEILDEQKLDEKISIEDAEFYIRDFDIEELEEVSADEIAASLGNEDEIQADKRGRQTWK